MSESGILKTVPVIRNLSLNPSCSHGPTILFDRNGSRFFSCSAYRSKKLCSFHLTEEQWISSKGINNSSSTSIKRKLNGSEDSPAKISKGDVLVNASRSNKAPKDSNKSVPLSDPNQRDKGEAQYHFTDETVQFFIKTFQNAKVDSILCIGTPSLHEYIRGFTKSLKLKSFLLDIDQRFLSRYSKDEFALYNMCNHHFFEENSKSNYLEFLSQAQRLAILTDPPFGVKVELIWNGCLKGVHKDLGESKKIDEDKACSISELFWIFPYFMEGHILNKCTDSGPGFQMSDYVIAYRNHKKFSGKTSNKSSPVRLFTTRPLSKLELPEDSYRYCDLCDKWVIKNNIHCRLCGTCPTKDGGGTYIHCKKCKRCVKPTWFHCQNPCGTCHLKESNCQVKDKKIVQTIPKKRGHKIIKHRK